MERREEFERYAWSSHRDYAGRRKPAPWLSLDWLGFWGRGRREAHRRYREEMSAGFGRPVANPWEELRGGLVLGTEALWRKARQLIGRKEAQEGLRWSQREGAKEARERVRRMVAQENDPRLQIWARVRLGGERGRQVANENGYRDGSGVTQVVKRLEAAAERNRDLRLRMDAWRRRMSIIKG